MNEYIELPRFIPTIHSRGMVSIPRDYWPILRKTLAEQFGATLNVLHIDGGRFVVAVPYASALPFYYLQITARREDARDVAVALKGMLETVVEEYTSKLKPFPQE